MLMKAQINGSKKFTHRLFNIFFCHWVNILPEYLDCDRDKEKFGYFRKNPPQVARIKSVDICVRIFFRIQVNHQLNSD